MVNSTLKILKGIFVECMECLNENAKKKKKIKGQILYTAGRDDQLLPMPNCLIIFTSFMDSMLIK